MARFGATVLALVAATAAVTLARKADRAVLCLLPSHQIAFALRRRASRLRGLRSHATLPKPHSGLIEPQRQVELLGRLAWNQC